MDIKTIMPIKFELVETAPLFHELLNLRSTVGRPSIRAGLYIVKLVNKPIQSNEFHSIMDDLYQSIISH